MAEGNIIEQTVTFNKGDVLYRCGDAVDSIMVIVKGKVLIQNDKLRTVVGNGSFIGVYDLYKGDFFADYIAIEDTVVISIPLKSVDDIPGALKQYPGYGGLLVYYFSKRIKTVYSLYLKIIEEAVSLGRKIKNIYNDYLTCCIENYFEPEELIGFEEHCGNIVSTLSYEDQVKYYIVSNGINQEIQSKYYGASSVIYMRHVEEQQNLLTNLYEDTYDKIRELDERVGIFAKNRINIFSILVNLVINLEKQGKDGSGWKLVLDELKKDIDNVKKFYESYLGRTADIDDARIDKKYNSVHAWNEDKDAVSEKLIKLEDSLEKITEYVGLTAAETEAFRSDIVTFMGKNDKYVVDSEMIKLRRSISDVFYEIYSKAFLRTLLDESIPIYIKLLLRYGFISEELLSREQLEMLVSIDDLELQESSEGPCVVYTFYEWLRLIYEGEKEPSKNEFDMDFTEYLRDKVVRKELTDKEAKAMLDNSEERVLYELNNMFRSVNRQLSEKPTAFVPILYGEACIQNLYNVKLTAYKLNSTVNNVTAIDYSVFSREVMYTNPKIGIEKDYVVKDVYPDVILMPCYGSRAVMWQEISGKRRDSEGRIMYPALFDADEMVTMVSVLGRFRWELCKTIQGVKWNDVRIKSLTSEYQDYIQFFRKNSALSDEWKEKIFRQIRNARNNTKEIFVKDYIEWIMRESTGGMRLNKYVREIFATYCPFAKEIRGQLESVPVYFSAMKRFKLNNTKKLREYEAKCIHLTRAGKEVPAEIERTKEFYNS
ncbi:MAG: cyclic nucleotide-binding domain-containing protein [Lachnospiraceae bacterium]|nr:cyclic nucleotide-binding domain-containing protein [Lachnospiraceae bacterium]